MRLRTRAAIAVVLILGLACAGHLLAQSNPSTGAVRRILVKLRAPLAGEIETALPLQEMALSRGEGSPTIQTFMSRYSVQRMAPLYPGIVRAKKQRGVTDRQIALEVRQRFTKRASRLRATFQPPEISRTYVLDLTGISPQERTRILQRLKADANVEFAEEAKVVSVNFTPNDPYFSSSGTWGQPYDDLWGIKKVGAPAAWDTNAGEGVVVAVVDTGLDYNHPDIAGNVWTNPGEIPGNGIDDDGNGYVDDVRGWNFVSFNNVTLDDQGHGTHVAGTIAAAGNNGIGVIGVAWHSRIMPVKGLDSQGSGYDYNLANAITYAANNGADVISNSWGGFGSSQTVADAVSYAYNLGAVVVAAAGNSSIDARGFFPANLPNVITVAATDPNDSLASFSNWGSKIDVAAPGVDILSLRANGTTLGAVVGSLYVRADGTSMAAPHVSGVAALILSQHPAYSNEDVRQVMRVSASDLGPAGFDLDYGYGRLNATAALALSNALETKISAPADSTRVTGPVTISGVARGNGFVQYTLEYGVGALPSSWTVFQIGTTPASGALGVFDATAVPDGLYTIRLTAYDAFGHAFVDRIQLTVNCVTISSPGVPSFQTSSTSFKPGVMLPIIGSAVGATLQNFTVQWAPGFNASSGWSTQGITLAGGGLAPIANGTLATWDTSFITGTGYYTLRLLVTDSGYVNEVRTSVYSQPDLLSTSWPRWISPGPYLDIGPAVAANLDGTLRLVVESTQGGLPLQTQLFTFSPDGVSQTSLPLSSYGSFSQPVAADLDPAPGQEVALVDGEGGAGQVRVFRADGSNYSMQSATQDFSRYPLLVEDLDGDSQWELLGSGNVVPAFGDITTTDLYAWRKNGQLFNGNFPLRIAENNQEYGWYNRQRFLVGDIHGDGIKDIVALEGTTASTFRLLLFGSDGTPRTWNAPTFDGMFWRMVAADLDHNGKLEIIVAAFVPGALTVHVLQPDGSERAGWPKIVNFVESNYPQAYFAVSDLDRDGQAEIVLAFNHQVWVWHADGNLYNAAWPITANAVFSHPLIADVNGNGLPELLVFSWDNASLYYNEQLLVLDHNANVQRSWTLTGMNGADILTQPSATVGDFNGDGITDIALSYILWRGWADGGGVVAVLSTGAPYNPAANDWPMMYHDSRNTSIWRPAVSAPPTATATVTAVTTSSSPSTYGQSITFTATVTSSAGTPTGTVTFKDGANSLGTGTLNGSGQASFSTSSLAAGSHSITAVYGGDANFSGSTSGALTQTVNAAPASLTVISPNGGESWNVGTVHSITWSYTGSLGSMKIELLKSGSVVQTISTGAPLGSGGSGSFSWTIPTTKVLSTSYRIRLTSTANAAISDTSNADFRINRTGIAVTVPNGGETWRPGTTQTLRWIWSGSVGSAVRIELFKSGGLNRTITSSTAIGAGGSGSFNWAIPSNQVTGPDFKVKVTSTSSAFFTDQSDANFSFLATDFSLIDSPDPVTVQEGGSNTTSVSATTAGGFSAAITLSCTNVSPTPAAGTLSCDSFTPNPFTPPGGSSDITLSASADLTPGSYTVTVSGTGGGITHTKGVTVNVPDYTLGLSPASQNVIQGSANLGGTATAIAGFSSLVNLSCGVAPADVNITCTPDASVTPTGGGAAFGVAVTVGPGAVNQSYTLTITGSDGAGHVRTATSTLSKQNFAVAATNTAPSIEAGSSATYSTGTLVTGLSGFTGNVTMSCTSGSGSLILSSCVFTPNPVAASGPGTSYSVQVNTDAASTPGGPYTVHLTGTVGSATRTADVTLTVTPTVDFSMSASPPSQTINAGQSATVNLTLTSINGFSSAVTITCLVGGAPAGTSCTPPGGTVTPTGGGAPSSVTVNTTSGTVAPGTYSVTVTGTGGAKTHSQTVSVTVRDFSLSVTPPSQSVAPGATADYTVSTSTANGFPDNAALTCAVLTSPTGTGCSFDSSPLAPGGSTTLHASSTGATPPASYTVQVTATSGSTVHSSNLTFTVASPNDFTLTTSTPSLSVNHGAFTLAAVTVTASGTFAESVTLSCTGLPANVSCFPPAAFVPPTSGTNKNVTVFASSTAVPGAYSFQIKGTSATKNHSVSINLTIN